MGTVAIRPSIHRKSLIPDNGLQIGARGDRWEEEFIKNLDFSTMDTPTDWSYLFRDSKAYNFDLGGMNSSNVTNMDYMFNGTHAGTLRLAGLTIGANTSAQYFLSGSFDAIDFTGATFYSLPSNMLSGATVTQGIQLRTLDVSNLTTLGGMFMNANLASLDLTGFDTHTITDMNCMFYGATIPVLTGLNTLDYSHVTNTYRMFCEATIPEIDMSGINFEALQNSSYMFYLGNTSQAKTVDLSGSSFPVLADAQYMFYSYTGSYGAPPRSPGLEVDFTDTDFSSPGINAYYMFAYYYAPDGLDLSCLANTKILNGMYMFDYAAIGETDFTALDFSEANSGTFYGYSNPFYYCYTPVVHIKTEVPYNVGSYSYSPFSKYTYTDEVILELTMHSSMGSFNYFIGYDNEGESRVYKIKNSELYATSINYFIYSGYNRSPISVEFTNTTLHLGNSSSLQSFLSVQCGGTVDMRGLTIDGTFRNPYYFSNYTSFPLTVYFPPAGMKFSGTLNYLFYGYGGNTYNTYYNVDKFDVSEVTSIGGYIFCALTGDYDLSGWDVSNVKGSMGYAFLNYCSGNFDFHGWRLGGVTAMGSTLINYFSGTLNMSNWDVSGITYISQLCYNFDGHLDIRNWNLSNCNSLYGFSGVKEGSTLDFDGWIINANQNMGNCCLLSADENVTVYVPNTVYKATSYTGTMFYCSIPSTYSPDNVVVDLYTNATSVEAQGWTFNHIYTAAEPYGYRIHLNSTHDDFLNAIGGD